MSPTSYRTAPPRINTLKEKGGEVKEFEQPVFVSLLLIAILAAHTRSNKTINPYNHSPTCALMNPIDRKGTVPEKALKL